MYKEVARYARNLGSEIEFDAPMGRYTSFRCGGTVTLMIFPKSVHGLVEIYDFCRKFSVEPVLLGNGTNTLVSDKGLGRVVIKIGNDISKIRMLDETTVYCEAGCSMKSLCNFALDHSLTGLEFAYGIPGTVGGGVYMNAGAYGGEMKDVLVSVDSVDDNGNIIAFSKEELGLGYRKSVFCENKQPIISATLKLEKGNQDEIKAKMDELLARRKEKQPLEYPSAGSTFKRPEGHFAGALIEQCGLKGYSVGGAQVSEKHAGFVINKNHATATDVITLIRQVQKKVYETCGVKLEPEVRILGEGGSF